MIVAGDDETRLSETNIDCIMQRGSQEISAREGARDPRERGREIPERKREPRHNDSRMCAVPHTLVLALATGDVATTASGVGGDDNADYDDDDDENCYDEDDDGDAGRNDK